jgi:gamma-glutamyltranspeptidase/glutathione hydrolase
VSMVKRNTKRTKGTKALWIFCVLCSLLLPYVTESKGQAAGYTNAAVVSVDPIASSVGVDILKKGGNAVDAAVATGFALAVTWPGAGNLGGGGFMLIYLAKKGEAIGIDYREKSPEKARMADSHRRPSTLEVDLM